MESLHKGDFIFNTSIILYSFTESLHKGDSIRSYESVFNHHIQGSPQISSRDIGYVLRILGQNPTEDEIVEMVMKVNNPI